MLLPVILYVVLFVSLIILITIIVACVLDKDPSFVGFRIALICLGVLGLVLVIVQIGDLASTTETKSQVDGIVLRTDVKGNKNLIWVEVETEWVKFEIDDNVFAHIESGQIVKLEKTDTHSWLHNSIITYTLLTDGT